jgi:hypothetical protein
MLQSPNLIRAIAEARHADVRRAVRRTHETRSAR